MATDRRDAEGNEGGGRVTQLPVPSVGGEQEWVIEHLGHLTCDSPQRSPRFRGTQAAADGALAEFDVAGYAGRRNEVSPNHRRGASGLSPWIRHGMLLLPQVWKAVEGGPSRDVAKFRDELLWQEYARHLYARLGSALAEPLRAERIDHHAASGLPGPGEHSVGGWWDRSMLCVGSCLAELEREGWLVNQTRMWLASHWSVRHSQSWTEGEDWFFSHLLDGSRAANRTGWQWTSGTGTGRPYGFARWQVEKRAPGLCSQCSYRDDCPIQSFPETPADFLVSISANPRLRSDSDRAATAGPTEPVISGVPTAVWLTAESMGDSDPALAAHPDLPVVFVFDEPLLARLRLSGKRLVFLSERLAELAQSRDVDVVLGSPGDVLSGQRLATTFAPVPGWKRLRPIVRPVEVHPWPWLRIPHGGSVASFSAWVS